MVPSTGKDLERRFSGWRSAFADTGFLAHEDFMLLKPRPAFLRPLALRASRSLGLFALARAISRRRLRILCYHGLSVGDEHNFEPILFMSPRVLRQRLETLRRLGYPVVSLEHGLRLLDEGAVDNAQVVLTFDDGWKSTLTHAAPLLKEFEFPGCVYVTTYYCDTQQNLFNIVVRYILWKTSLQSVTLTDVHPALDGVHALGLQKAETARTWIRIGESMLSAAERENVLAPIAAALGQDISDVVAGERFKLMDAEEVRRIAVDFDWEVQLHTHRHVLPEGSIDLVRPEITENRARLQAWTGQSCTDFCYPSGKYHTRHPEWLRSLGLRSATTCDPGLNGSHTDQMLLKRYLDRETWCDLEFEAAISGFGEIVARVLSAIGLRRN